MSAKIPSKQLSLGLMSGGEDLASDVLITDLSMPLANTEYAHALQPNLKQVIISRRGAGDLKLSFVLGQSGTIYKTIYSGSCLTLDRIIFTGKSLYLQSTSASAIVEIVELF